MSSLHCLGGDFRPLSQAATAEGGAGTVGGNVTTYPLAVYGNLECMAFHPDACGWQQNRMGVMAAAHVDVVLLEALMTHNEFKVALAAGNFEKPVRGTHSRA